MMSVWSPTDIQKSKAWEHILYEMNELALRYLHIKELEVRTSNPVFARAIYNGMLESLLLHSRNLIHFFEGPRKKDDILAQDFLIGDDSELKLKIDVPSEWRERMNKDIAHLTYARTERTQESKTWDIVGLVTPILQTCDKFLESTGRHPPYQNVLELAHKRRLLKQKLAAANSAQEMAAQEKTTIQRQIDSTDRQINQLVYQLYALTSEEIAIVEEGTAK